MIGVIERVSVGGIGRQISYDIYPFRTCIFEAYVRDRIRTYVVYDNLASVSVKK